MRKWNKLLAMLLAMVMVFGLTATAFAAEGDTDTDAPVTAPAEGEEKTDDAAPAEGEDKTDDAAPAEGEDKTDDTAPAGDEEKKDEPAAVTFTDVAENNWFYASVMKMVAAGVVKGYEDGTFKPGNEVKWGEAMKMVVVFATGEEKDPVEGGNWASGYAAYLKEQKVLEADVDINKVITRVEMCQMLAKALKIEASEKESTFPDTKDGYVVALVEKGIIKGNPDGTFAPDGTLTRAALCQMLAAVPAAGDDAGAADPAAPAEGEEKKDDAAPTEGEDKPADGDAPAEGDKPAEGEDKPVDGDAPVDGETPADGKDE